MTRTIDFDAFRAEQKAEAIQIKIGGETYDLAADMPAEVALEVVALRAELGNEAEVPTDKIVGLASALFGEELFDVLIHRHRLTATELGALVTFVFGQYNKAMVPNPTAPTNGAKPRTRKRSSSAS